jgi:hypothetical protein
MYELQYFEHELKVIENTFNGEEINDLLIEIQLNKKHKSQMQVMIQIMIHMILYEKIEYLIG